MAKFALLIGVSEYLEGSFAALPAVTQDVEAMREVLQNPEIGGFEPDKIKTLINPHNSGMSEAIETYFSDAVSDDLILFYFSGHGVKDEQRNLYFSAQNTRKHRDKLTTSTAVAASFVRNIMTAYKAKRKVIILDCCFSGAFGEFIGKDDGSLEIEGQLGAEGTVVMTSSGSTQYSFQQKNGDLSLYTRYLVEGMRTGAADKNGDGFISVGELHNYVRGRIEEAAPALVTPKIIVLKDEGYKIHFAKAPKGDSTLIYRQEVAKYARGGKFSVPARKILDRLKNKFNLSSAEAEAIEAEVLQPYREYEGNLQEYEETLKEAIEEEYPLSQDTLRDLKDYQHQLGLRDEDIKPIEAKVIPKEGDLMPVKVDVISQTSKDFEPEMVDIPAGTFKMGSDEYYHEKPIHNVTLSAFQMGKYPVTQAQYEAVMGENPAQFSENPQNPVEAVSWFDAQAFCEKLSQLTGKKYRLPTEAEWEYACRAGTQTRFSFGDYKTQLGEYAWFEDNSEGKTHPVGEKLPNTWGLYDMHGNVWEWCADEWHDSYQDKPANLKQNGNIIWASSNITNKSYMILRGGAWVNSSVDCRSANRSYYDAENCSNDIGFRVAVSGF